MEDSDVGMIGGDEELQKIVSVSRNILCTNPEMDSALAKSAVSPR